MNHKGQALILFVFFIPVIIILFALVVDIGYMNIEKNKYHGIMEEGMRQCITKQSLEALKSTFEMNGLYESDYQVSYEGDVEVLIHKKVPSIFGKMIAIEEYEIALHYVGKQENGEFIIERIEKGRLT